MRLCPGAAAVAGRLGESDQVLLPLEQRAEKRHPGVQLHAGDPRAAQHGDPVDQLAGGGSLAQAVHVADGVEGTKGRVEEFWAKPGWCTRTIRAIRSFSGNSMKWNTQRRKNASGSSFSALEVMTTTGRSR